MNIIWPDILLKNEKYIDSKADFYFFIFFHFKRKKKLKSWHLWELNQFSYKDWSCTEVGQLDGNGSKQTLVDQNGLK